VTVLLAPVICHFYDRHNGALNVTQHYCFLAWNHSWVNTALSQFQATATYIITSRKHHWIEYGCNANGRAIARWYTVTLRLIDSRITWHPPTPPSSTSPSSSSQSASSADTALCPVSSITFPHYVMGAVTTARDCRKKNGGK